MPTSRNQRAPLIIDSDPIFIQSVDSDPNSKKYPPVIATTGRDAQILLSDHNQEFAGIFLNPSIARPGGLSIIRCAHHFHPGTPMYLLYDEDNPFSEKEIKQLGIQKALPKPITYTDLVSLVQPLITVFNPENAVAVAKQNSDQLNSEINIQDIHFIPIRAENFLAGTVSFFDIYIRLSSSKYLKLLQAGDRFSPDRVTNYLKKGLTYFYLRKEAQEHYLKYCDNLTAAVIASPNIPTDVKISQTLNHGDETLKFFKDMGIQESNIHYARNFVKNANNLIKKIKPERYPFLAEFLNDVSSYQHGTATTVIASLLLQPLQITSLEPVETVGIASLLHDIGLRGLPEVVQTEDETQMTDTQKALYRKHPSMGAELIKSVAGLKPAVVQAVLQHHERRSRKGFPYQLGAGSISLVSEIVGISDEFSKIINRIKKDPQFNYQTEMEIKIYGAFSSPLVSEFKKMFQFDLKSLAGNS